MLEGFVPWPKDFAKLYQEKGYWQGISLGEAFENWAKKFADNPAIAYEGKDITYRQLDIYATRLAYHMTKLGMKTYDRIILQLFNTPELVYLFYACMKIGVIPVCSLPTHRWAEISYIAKESEARAQAIPAGSVKDFDYEDFADRLREEIQSIKYIFTVGTPVRPGMSSINELVEKEIDLEEAKAEIKKYRPDPMEPALFQLSGGTTGVPKIITRTHNDYLYNAKCVASRLAFTENSRILLTMPLAHNYGLINNMLPVHNNGGCLVLSLSQAPQAILEAIPQNRPDTISTVPVFMHRLLEIPKEIRDKYDYSSLRRNMGVWNPDDLTVQEFMDIFHCDGVQSYGMTEGFVCWTRWSDPPDIRHRTNGTPVSSGDEYKVVDPETHEEVAPGNKGEMWCRGPYTIRGYYKSPERNREAFTPDGYYRTGDLVIVDRQGNITWTGRIKDCIDRGAEKINAEEVETSILKFPKVKSVAIVGMPDKALGERVCAFVVLQPGVTFTLDELRDFLSEEINIAAFKLPERLEFIDELPITKIGKYEKKSLREKITETLKKEGKA